MGYPPKEQKPAQQEIRQQVLSVFGALIGRAKEGLPESVRQAFDFTGIDHEARKTADHLSGQLREGIRELGREQGPLPRSPLVGGGDPAVRIARPMLRDKGKLDFQARRSELVSSLTAGKEANWLKGVDRAGLGLAQQVQELARFEFVSEMPKGREALAQGAKLKETAESLYSDFVRYMSELADKAGKATSEDVLADTEARASDLAGFFAEYGQHVLNVAAVVHAIVQSEAWKAAIPTGSGGVQRFKDGVFAVLKGIVPLAQGAIARVPMAAELLSAVQGCLGGIQFCVDELDRSFGRMIRDVEIAKRQKADPGLARRILNSDPARMASRVCDSQQAAVHRAFNVAGAVVYAIPEAGKFWPCVRTICEGAISDYYKARVTKLKEVLAEESEKAQRSGTTAAGYVNGLEGLLDKEWEGSWEAIKEVILRAAGAGAQALAESLYNSGLVSAESLRSVAGKLSGIVSGLQGALAEITAESAIEAVKLIAAKLITGLINYIVGEMVRPAQPVTGDEIWAVLRGLREGAVVIPVLLGGSAGVYDRVDAEGEEAYRRQQARKAEEARQGRNFQQEHASAAALSGIADLDGFMRTLMSDALDGSGGLDGWLEERPSILAIYHDAGSPDRTVKARADLYAVAREVLETSNTEDPRGLRAEIAARARNRILHESLENRIAYLIAEALKACARRRDDQARARLGELEDAKPDWQRKLADSVLSYDKTDEAINELLIPPADTAGR